MYRAHGELPPAEAAVLLGDVDRPQPAIARLLLELGAQRPRDVAVEQELLLERREALLAELARDRHEALDVVGEVEVHSAG